MSNIRILVTGEAANIVYNLVGALLDDQSVN
jgi:hypothetical protein